MSIVGVRAFFAYSSHPTTRAETVKYAITSLRARAPYVEITPWEALSVGGKVVVREICRRIDASDLFVADATGINPNVMFEMGYAVGRRKRIWIVLDTSVATAKRDYSQLEILTGIGYVGYHNSEELVAAFLRERPFEDLSNTVFSAAIEPALSPGANTSLLYLRSLQENEADRRLSELVSRYQRTGLPATIDDPTEAKIQPLGWYGQRVYSAIAVLAHLSNETREGWQLHNARYAFVCGLACGLEKPLLMLSEVGYETPFDYRDLLARYSSVSQCLEVAGGFLERIRASHAALQETTHFALAPVELATELRGLRVGEYIAEHEAARLDGYFVETAAYGEALIGRHTIFVGRKGSGKTANLIRIASELGHDRRNLVVVVKPVAYDLDAVVRLLRKYRERDAKGYLVESLWKFLLYSELALASAVEIRRKHLGAWTAEERALIDLMERERSLLLEDFAVRLERSVDSLLALADRPGIEETRVAISEALHEGLLKELRVALGAFLHHRERVAILVDNLDKAWSPSSDLENLSYLLLGLLGAASRLSVEFGKADHWRKEVALGLTVFLRSDIFHYVTKSAREPDKISYSRLIWTDREMLLRIIDQRLVASRSNGVPPAAIWNRYFCPMIAGIPIREYLTSQILPRPRDLVFLVRAAIQTAVNRGHARVEESDVLEAERSYSLHALDTLEVEGGATIPKLLDVLFEFLSASEIVSRDEVVSFLVRAGTEPERHQSVIDQLCALSFLGLEVHDGEFAFSADEDELEKNLVLARKLGEARNAPSRYRVNVPFHKYLEIHPV